MAERPGLWCVCVICVWGVRVGPRLPQLGTAPQPMWVADCHTARGYFANPNGLFPAPLDRPSPGVLRRFRLLGRLLGKALLVCCASRMTCSGGY